jgi:hypothetical protein
LGGQAQKGEPARISLMAQFAPPANGGDTRDDAFSYRVTVDVAAPDAAAFTLVKEETLTFHHGPRLIKLLERRGPHVVARDEKGLGVISRWT